MDNTFAILISTKNRKEDLEYTLSKIQNVLDGPNVTCVVTDDGSTDGTSEFIKKEYPQIVLYTNKISKGYLFCRNAMLNATKATYAISLDDDAHFVTANPLEVIDNMFLKYPEAGVLGFRIIWTKAKTFETKTQEDVVNVQSFVGCGHVWRMAAWNKIPDYPEWFKFYGEENFASFHLYKSKWCVMYVPQILVQHRVELKSRKLDSDYIPRLRRSLFTGWSIMGLFYPLQILPRRLSYSIWIQLKKKVFKGDIASLRALIGAFIRLIFAIPKIVKERKGFSRQEFQYFEDIEPAKIYWKGD